MSGEIREFKPGDRVRLIKPIAEKLAAELHAAENEISEILKKYDIKEKK